MTQPPNAVFSPEYDHLRGVLISVRQEARLTQASVAARLGRSAPFVALFEKGQRRLDVLDFFNLVTAIGGDPSDVIQKVFAGFSDIQRSGRASTASTHDLPLISGDAVHPAAR